MMFTPRGHVFQSAVYCFQSEGMVFNPQGVWFSIQGGANVKKIN
jgi:hypothetical protein